MWPISARATSSARWASWSSVRRNASVVTVSPATAVVMTGRHFRQMRRELPAVCDRIEQAVRERCREIVPASA